jgi:uncharacterized repeat protein (TIGR04138 family)
MADPVDAAEFEATLRRVLEQDPRYRAEAYMFLLESLDHTIESLGRKQRTGDDRHVSGPELLEGVREVALEKFGFLAPGVFHQWGVRATLDFGEIVFNLVEARLLKRRPEDRKEDFRDVYDFREVFDRGFVESFRWEE